MSGRNIRTHCEMALAGCNLILKPLHCEDKLKTNDKEAKAVEACIIYCLKRDFSSTVYCTIPIRWSNCKEES